MARRKNNSKLNFDLREIEALNKKQKQVLSSNNNLVLAGVAGTGKTFLATWMAFNAYFANEYRKIVFLRSAVPTRDIGFLPGTEKDKMKVYKAPYTSICNKLFNRGDAFEVLEQKFVVYFEPTSFLRGTEFEDSFVIVDEFQNMSYHELDSVITRIGDNCRIIFCGDIAQSDLYKNGFKDFISILERMKEFDLVYFGIEDIVRSGLVKSYLEHKAALSAR